MVIIRRTSNVARDNGSSNFENFGLREAAIRGSKCKGTLDGSSSGGTNKKIGLREEDLENARIWGCFVSIRKLLNESWHMAGDSFKQRKIWI